MANAAFLRYPKGKMSTEDSVYATEASPHHCRRQTQVLKLLSLILLMAGMENIIFTSDL